jgi:hypothetical protein
MDFMSPPRVLAALVGVAFLASCASDGSTGPEPKPEPTPQPGIHVVAGGSISDTVGAVPTQALVVEVRGTGGVIAPGVVVGFESITNPPPAYCRVYNYFPCPDRPGVQIAGLASDTFNTARGVTTNPQGRAAVRVQFGTATGEGKVLVTVPELGFRDTVRYTVRPGSAHRVVVVPADTVLYVNTSFAPRGVVIDRHGNARPESAQLSGGAGLGVEGSSVTARDYGFHELTAQHPGVPPAVGTVAVVPRGTLAVVTRDWLGDSIVIVDLDGSNRRRIPTGSDVNGLAWTPDGTRLVASLGTYYEEKRLHTITLDGVRTPLPTGESPSYHTSPVFSADRKWLFFVSRGRIGRTRPDGSGLQNFDLPDFYAGDVGPSPDASRVAVASLSSSNGLVYGIGTGAAASLRDLEAGSIRWSPNGTLLAFNSARHGVGLVAPDGSNLRRVTGSINSRDLRLDWSPDGKWIVFHGGTDLELIQVETGRRIPLHHMSWHLQPAWRP